MVPPIRLIKRCQEITLRIYFNCLSVDYVKKKGGVSIREYTCGGSCGLIVQICIVEIIFGKKKKIIGSLALHIGILDDEFG